MLIPNLQLNLSQEVRFLIYLIIHIIYAFEGKIGQPKFEAVELKKVIVLIRNSRDIFTLKLNNCIYSMIIYLDINYIFTPVKAYI